MSYPVEYRTPCCRQLVFKAEGVLAAGVESRCKCGDFVRLVAKAARVLHRTYRCSDCGRTQHVENPKNDRSHCIVCGTPTLVIVDEVAPMPRPPTRQSPQRAEPAYVPRGP